MKKDLKGKKPAKTYNITEKERQKLIYMRQAQFTITNHISGWPCSQRTPEPSVFLVLILLNNLEVMLDLS